MYRIRILFSKIVAERRQSHRTANGGYFTDWVVLKDEEEIKIVIEVLKDHKTKKDGGRYCIFFDSFKIAREFKKLRDKKLKNTSLVMDELIREKKLT